MAKTERENKKVISFPAGMTFKPLYEKCPLCGCDLNQLPNAFVDKVNTDSTEDGTSKAEFSFETSSKKALAPNLFDLCKAWMVLPFSTAKKYSTKRNKKRLIGWKFWK